MKRKVNIDRPKVSSDEINQRRNFDSVLKNTPGISAKPLFKKPWFLSGVVVATVAIVATIALMNKDQEVKNPEPAMVNSQVTDNDSLALSEFYIAEEAKPCIAPPIAGLNVPYTVFRVNSEKGGELNFKTGSKLTVPKNAFTDENGKPVKGEVELRYREFHDAADFFVSGIPMTYDSAGIKYQFESAGMIEMLAFQNDKPLAMASGKTINVEMVSDYKGTEYNLYKLDTVKNNWSCLGKDKVEMKPGKKEEKNSENFDDGDKDFDSSIAKLKETPEYRKLEVKIEEAKVEKEKEIAALPVIPPAPKKPLKASPDKFTFNFELDLKDFPEFASYKDVKWEVGAENKTFNQSVFNDINKTEWEDATIKEGSKKGENYLLSLTKGSKKIKDLVVYPTFEGRNYEAALKDFQEKFEKYSNRLEKRKTDERRIEEEYQAKIAKQKADQEELQRQMKKKMEDQYASMSTEEKAIRVFRVSSFGVFNCDNPSAYPSGVSCVATLANDKKTKLMCYDVYLVDKKRNALFTFYKNPVTNLSFNPNSSNILWTVENGVLYCLKPEQFTNIKAGTHSIQMNRVEQKFESVDDMRKFFNL